MGCTDCGRKGGCDTRKGSQRGVLDEALARVYGAERVWGQPDDEARFGAGVPRAEVRRLRRALATVAQAPTWFRAGEGDDLCDFVWLLCIGREPALVELHEADGASSAHLERYAADLVPGVAVEETYLRVAFSSVARLAAMQEVRLSLEQDQSGGFSLACAPRPGVFDPVLLKRVRKIVALLEASDIAHLDFGLLDVPLADSAPGDYATRYGVEPRLANFLFQAAPSTVRSVTYL